MSAAERYAGAGMHRRSISRVWLVAAVAVASVVAGAAIVAAAPAGAGPAALEPDLVTIPFEQEDLAIQRDGGRTLLRLSNEIGNRGAGPLEIAPSPSSQNCDGDGDALNDRNASQRIYADGDANGIFSAGADAVESERVFGCMQYHPVHDHWHVLQFSRYELRPRRSRKAVVRASKVGFCVADSRRAFPGAGSPLESGYPVGTAAALEQRGCQVSETQGLSPGWADTYLFNLSGQELDVTELPAGRYCLVSMADPRNLIEELDERNNATRVRIALRPELLRVRALERPCGHRG